jgi:hypothetical protein
MPLTGRLNQQFSRYSNYKMITLGRTHVTMSTPRPGYCKGCLPGYMESRGLKGNPNRMYPKRGSSLGGGGKQPSKAG